MKHELHEFGKQELGEEALGNGEWARQASGGKQAVDSGKWAMVKS